MRKSIETNCIVCKKLFLKASPRFNTKQRRKIGSNVRPSNVRTCSRVCARVLVKNRKKWEQDGKI